MASKSKPGLVPLVRTLAQSHSQSLSHSHHPGHKHIHHYAHHVPASSILSNPAASGSGLPPISTAPVVSHYPPSTSVASSSSVSQAISRRVAGIRGEGFEASEGEKEDKRRENERAGPIYAPWPVLPAVPPRESIINSSAYSALVLPWDGTSTYSATDAVLGAFNDMVVTPYRTFAPLRHSHSRRAYTTSTKPSRNASGYMHHPSPSSLEFYYSSHIYAKFGNHPSGPGAGTGNEPLDPPYIHSYPPPPPPSPGPSRPPQDQSLTPRPSETHTVLSPAPITPGDTGGNNNSTPNLVIGGAQYLSPPDIHSSSPLTPPETSDPVACSPYSSKLVFRFGASGLAKDRPIIQSPRPPRKGASPTPPPRPRSFPLVDIKAPASLSSVSIGEDSYFATPDGICVADGVGGWARSGRGGADAGRWSRLLTHYCHDEVRAWWQGAEEYCEDTVKEQEDGKGWKGMWRKKEEVGRAGDELGLPEGRTRRKLDPVEVMQRGFEKCLSCVLSEGIYGSSTCLLVLLHHSSLRIANLGDCCVLVVRDGEIVFRTSEMQHAFNFPLQVGTHSRDEPMKDAKQFEVEVEERDVVVVGSDGLMDNLFDEDILDVLAQFAPLTNNPPAPTDTPGNLPTPPHSRPNTPPSDLPPFNPQKLSEALCKKAREVSEELNATTPFMVRAIEEGIDFVGGKKDDISVVVGVIRNGSTSELWT